MPTIRQKKLAKALIENLQKPIPDTAGQVLENVGYSKHLAKQPGRVIDTPGVQKLLDKYLPDELITGKVNWLLHHDEWQAVNAGVDKAAKLKGMYAAEKHTNVNVNIDVETNPKAIELAKEYEEKLKTNLLSEDA